MKKGYLIGIGILLVLIGAYAFAQYGSYSSEQPSLTTQTVPQEENSFEGEEYAISSDSVVRYHAQKEFFSKPTQEVIGENAVVDGTIYLNENSFSLSAVIDDNSFVTDSSGRDRDVAKLLTEPLVISAENIPVDMAMVGDGVRVPLTVSINGVSQVVEFDVTATVSDETIETAGSGELRFSDYGIDPPSALNIYTVNDVLGLSFDIQAQK